MTTRAGGLLARDEFLALAMCTACAFSFLSFGSFPALMPRLFLDWQLSTREATFVNAAFYAGYVLVSPILTTLTDRMDARRIVLVSCVLGALAAAAFASSGGILPLALCTRALSGVATAGSFMPGLRALTDRASAEKQARYVGYYMGSFALGTSLSYAACEALAAGWGARTALAAMALGPCACFALTLTLRPLGPSGTSKLDWLPKPLPIVRNRAAFGLICCYGLHTWELFTLRSWGVAFLSFVQTSQGIGAPMFWWAPATVVGAANVLTVPASVFGVSMAERLGRVRWVGLVMVASSLSFALLAWAGLLPNAWVCMALLLCAALMGADSATLTSGVMAQVPLNERGLGMAVHTTVGFLGAFVGPMIFGLILDGAGGPTQGAAWTRSFAISGAFTLTAGFLIRGAMRRHALDVAS